MQSQNFTTSKVWKQSNKIRYDISNVVTLDNIDFLIKEHEIICLQFFSVNFSPNLLKLLKSSIVNGKKIVFKYIDLTDEELFLLKDWCNTNKLQFIINDEWKAPILTITTPFDVYLNTKCSLVRRDYSKYKKDSQLAYKVYDGNLDLWTNVLAIDKKSWKGKDKCDMKSLDREDLQYIFYLMREPDKSSLMVALKDNEPLSYSLWFKADDDKWYAVKWGASDNGRKYNAGINVLFNHINHILSLQDYNLNLDFWGRRSQFYDMLKNKETKRYHFEIRG